MKTSLILSGLLALTAMALCGCGTISTRIKGDSSLYCGFAQDVEKVSSAEEWLTWSGQGSAGDVPFPLPRGLLWVVDAPLSLVADTIMLPADCLRSKTARANAEPEAGQPGGANGSPPVVY